MSAPTDNASALTRRRAPKPSTPYQNVFRVQFPTSNQTAQSDSHPVKRQSVKRRSHRKSRLGCGNCKRRRVKCDETQPHCERCRKYGITCDFETLGDAPLDSTLETLSLDLIEDTVRRLVGLDQWRHEKLVRLGPDSSRYTNLAYLYHFIVDLSQVMLQHNLRKVMQTDMIKVAFSCDHLMHTILAASCLHLNHCDPGNKARQAQEAYHWKSAVNLYRKAMRSPIGPHNVDALFGTCMLLGSSTLCPMGFRPEQSWVFTSNPADLNWLALQSGLRCLILMAHPYIPTSIWSVPFFEMGEEQRALQDDRPGREGLHQGLADFCGIDETTTAETSPYHDPLRILSPLLELKPCDQVENYNVVVSFIGRLQPEFINLLRAKDPRALMILAYWMGRICPMSSFQPWIVARIVPECIAVCMYLEQTSTDPFALSLLEFPAKACGYWRDSNEELNPLMTTALSNLHLSSASS